MCGIAGLITQDIRSIPVGTLDRMRARILYRGRDAQSEWSDEQNVHLFHTRLSIIDLTTGGQPMWDPSGRYVIVYNGEIYNYKELRREYTARGVQFQTQSDTEVILEGFKRKGESICRELNGIFAFAIWDTEDKRLFLARDHLGKKPLYWCTRGGAFYFASTLDAFHSIPGWDGALSTDALDLYNVLGGFIEDLTVYRDAWALPYASYAYIRPGDARPQVERYWRMDFSQKSSASLDNLMDEYETLLTDAVAIRLRADVPLAITFSGGVDSGTIASICTQRLNTSLVCYTIDYHTPDDPSQETQIAEKTARHLGLDWKYINFDYHTDLLRDLPTTYQYYDQPATQLALVYSQRLYECIKPFATVVLSGNGGDEIFTGYIGDEAYRRRDLFRARWGWARPILGAVGRGPLSGWASPLRARLASPLAAPIPISDDETRWQAALRVKADEEHRSQIRTFLDLTMHNRLTYGSADSNYRLPDVSGLAAQVEVRSPYLDYRMVEFAARLPNRFKIGNPATPQENKYLPKLYYARKAPAEIAWASKKGMGMNLKWHESIVRDAAYLDAFAQAFDALERAGLDASRPRDAWSRYRNGDAASSGPMMAGFMLGMWLARVNS